MKIIFLDVDGVLNSARSAVAFGNYPHNLSLESLAMFDHVSISLVRKVCREHGVNCVLSSTWRKCFTALQMSEALDLPIYDTTRIKYSGETRGHDIQDWLDKHPEVTEYAILDDDSDMLDHQKDRLVQTCPLDGFRYNDYLKLKQVLKIK